MNQNRLDFERPLYVDGLPGHHGKDTEVEAAKGVAGAASRSEFECYGFILNRGDRGATFHEVVEHFNDPSRQQRVSALAGRKLIVDSGERRASPRGRPCTVWVAADYASSP